MKIHPNIIIGENSKNTKNRKMKIKRVRLTAHPEKTMGLGKVYLL
jgi:ferredoxin-fold anticodon binding domain-containing protein